MDGARPIAVGHLSDLDYVKCFITSEVDIMHDHKKPMYSISFIENLKMESLCGKSNTIQILAICIAISIFVLLLGTILNITIWKRNQRTYNFNMLLR